MYEVRAYATQQDFDNVNATVILDGFSRKRDALNEGKLWLTDHKLVKVQSDDREYIEILSQEPRL